MLRARVAERMGHVSSVRCSHCYHAAPNGIIVIRHGEGILKPEIRGG